MLVCIYWCGTYSKIIEHSGFISSVGPGSASNFEWDKTRKNLPFFHSTCMRYVTLVSRLLRVTLVCFRLVWEGLKVTPSPHQEHKAELVKVGDGQMRHTTPYHTSLRPPMSTGGRHLKETPPSPLSYSQVRETGADGGAAEKAEMGRMGGVWHT